MKTLDEIKYEVEQLARIVGASGNDLPTYGRTRDLAYPHIEIDDAQYHYVIVERGQELERKSTLDFSELLYWIFSDVTHDLAFAYELHNRVKGRDCRRIAFSKQVELLSLISPKMAARQTEKISEILRSTPYSDEPK